MASKREPSPSMRMRKIALVICEGETEVGYISLLKAWYKSPVRIVSHIEGTKITPSLVEKRAKELRISQWDKVHTFLMYDMDVQTILHRYTKNFLHDNTDLAVARAKKLQEFHNPSTSIYKLIDFLKDA